MADFEIFADSSANLPEELRKKYNIHILSYIMNINGKDLFCYEEGVDFPAIAKKFYQEAMKEG